MLRPPGEIMTATSATDRPFPPIPNTSAHSCEAQKTIPGCGGMSPKNAITRSRDASASARNSAVRSGASVQTLGAIWDSNGRIEGEYPESWAHEIPSEFGWLHSGGHARRSDPGGTGGYELTQDRLRISAWTGDGSCANGFTPGPDRHYEQWRGWVTDQDAWPRGVREISLPGDLIWHVHIKAKGRGIDILHPDDSEIEPPPIEPPPVEPPPTQPPPAGGCPPEPVGPGASDLIYAHDQLVRAMRNWGTSKGDNQSRRSRDAIDEARRKMYG